MRKHTFLILLVTCFFSACYGEGSSAALSGEWLLQGTVNQSSLVECPDLLILGSDGRYLVLNDCYGENMKNPITEEGDWVHNDGDRTLVLENRTFESNYFFGVDSSDPLEIKIVQVSKEKLVLQFHSGDPEKYKSIKR